MVILAMSTSKLTDGAESESAADMFALSIHKTETPPTTTYPSDSYTTNTHEITLRNQSTTDHSTNPFAIETNAIQWLNNSNTGTEPVAKATDALSPLVLALPPPPTADVNGGDWNTAATWNPDGVPTSTTDIIIPNGYTVYINSDAVCKNLTIELGGTLVFNSANTLTVSGNFTNNGTFTKGSGTVVLNGAGSTISGASATSFNVLTINAGSNVSSVVTVNSSIVVNTLSLENGLLQINSGTTSISNLNPSTSPPHILPASAGIEVKSGGTLNTGAFTINNKGLIRIDGGIANFGSSTGNSIETNTDGAFIVKSGSTVNIAGRLHNSAGGTLSDGGSGIQSGITIEGGTIKLATVGNGLASYGTLNVTANGYFSFTAGTIIFENPSTATTAVDLQFAASSLPNGTKSISNGLFQFGDATADQTFIINSAIPIPNITTTNDANLKLAQSLTIDGNLNLSSGSQISLAGFTLTLPADASSIAVDLIDTNGDVSTATFSNISGYGAGQTITMNMVESKHPSDQNSSTYLDRYWQISTSAGISQYDLEIATPSSIYKPNTGSASSMLLASYNSGWTELSNASIDGTAIIITGLSSNSLTLSALEEPTATLSGSPTICEGGSAGLTINLTGAAPWEVVYNDGSNHTISGIASSPYTLTVTPGATSTYTLVSIADANLAGTVSGTAAVTVNTAPVFSDCPSSPINLNTTAGRCDAVATYTVAASGSPAPTYTYIFAGATTTGSVSGSGSGETFNVGTTIVTVTATNSCGSETCSFNVIVTDDEAPLITKCPDNVSKNVDDDACGAIVSYNNATATDNCNATITYSQVSGSYFPVGTTTVTATATDPTGNYDECTFTVTV
ncbi:HYR domain-containing protein, partial [Mangrovibacterium sp.]|uniref:HYR domain-containing protein n=1 Tax=Mangrovibacterium sp. TaxID=1961364 RepID=UPI00356754D5